MTEVRIRHEYDENAKLLGEVPLTLEALDRIIPLLNRWGVSDEDGNSYDEEASLYGQFRVTPSEAYFEIVLTGGGS